MWIHRKYLADYTNDPSQTLVPPDSVGGTLLLVKAEVHRSDILFPPIVYKCQIETKGFWSNGARC
jgi:hypothetical protein